MMRTVGAPAPVAASQQFRVQSLRFLRVPRPFASTRISVNSSRQALLVQAGTWAPPTVSETKETFIKSFPKPLPGIYSTVINELLVQQHLIRFNKRYQYDEVFALGFVSVFDQVAEGLDPALRAEVFDAYIKALQEDPEQYRKDAEAMEAWAKGLSGADEITPNAEGDYGQKVLAKIAASTEAGSFAYSKFFAIGLFRMLELAGAKDPKALGALVSALGVRLEQVNRDLLTYKGVLSKLAAAKELAAEYVARERKKQAERDAAKAAAEAKTEEPAKAEVPATEAA